MTHDERRIARRTFLGVAAAGALAACAANPTDDGAAATSDLALPSSSPSSSSAGTTATTSTSATTTTIAPSPVTPTTTATPGGAAAFVRSGPRTKNAVSLTFHANGDVALATRLLDILRERAVHVTVFGVGNWMEANPKLVARMLADGHEVANHTWSHPTMGPLGRAAIADEITRCARVLESLTGGISPWFRPSGIEVPTAAILDEAGKAGYRTSVGYDCDSLDFQDPGAKAVVANVAATVQQGSIVSVHFGHQNTADAMPALLDLLATRNLAPVTVGALLA